MGPLKFNRWRDGFNPLRQLTLPRLLSLLEAGDRGEWTDPQWLFRFMEMTDATLSAIITRRTSALLSLDWEIRTISAADPALAEEQAIALRLAYDRLDNLREALRFLALATFRGYAHLELHRDAAGDIRRMEPVEQWFWVRDGMFAPWEYCPDSRSGVRHGIPIDPEEFIIRETIPLHRLLALLYYKKNISMKDWDSFVELYGIPSLFLVGPPNTPAEKEEEYLEIAKEVIGNGRGYLPNGADIKFATPPAGSGPFSAHINYLDQQMVLAATGGQLTMLTQAGSGTLAGGAHADTFRKIAQQEAAEIAEVFQRQFDRPLLNRLFPGQPIAAYFEFDQTDPATISTLMTHVQYAAALGFKTDVQQIAEKTGLKLEPLEIQA